ncbi:MAG: NAD(P)-dependent glycerol-3-phosphate dehydrogenase [Acidobacteria bacterium]|nr:NAD(P)-dependent glycerol-3-phosphate dehydrogenase [Acidobacteriota bacterium]
MTGEPRREVAVLGAGGWGTALAVHVARLGTPVRLWGRNAALVETLQEERRNQVYLADVPFPVALQPTASLEEALARADYVVSAVPSHGTREVMRRAAPFMIQNATIVSATKGFERETLNRMSEVIRQEAGPTRPVVVLSGPSFAAELARGAPTAVLVASPAPGVTARVQEDFRSPYLRLYASEDVVGVEMGGALKNVIAIAAGVVEGLGLGSNALAALITRGLAEMSRLACAMGGRRDTLAGLSGIGDLILTCTGGLSRNRHVGIELGRGRTLPDILAEMRTVAEGVATTDSALALGRRHAVDIPIITQMAAILAGRIEARAAVEELMLRRQRQEADGVPPMR